MEIFANHKGFFIIKSLRIEKYIILWKKRTYKMNSRCSFSPK